MKRMRQMTALAICLAGAATSTSAAAGGFKVLYSFQNIPDGNNPAAAMIDVGGTFYGTTQYGGASDVGAVFSITSAGTETVLHSFNGTDGRFPFSVLTSFRGLLYGTSYGGGEHDNGTVYTLTLSGSEPVYYSFSKTFGNPLAGLLRVGGALYGTALLSPTNDGGVFSIHPNSNARILYSFSGSDGAFPEASLISVNGMLYGTTAGGGAANLGTVFALAGDGTETVLHSFGSAGDGNQPNASLIDVGGTLYGTTQLGGTGKKCGGGCGTVFAIAPDGTENVLYSFQGILDGAKPQAALINFGGTLYGTTSQGGSRHPTDQGTLFSITTGGTETVLYRFKHEDGISPLAALVAKGPRLYGTASFGGANGYGTVFSFKP